MTSPPILQDLRVPRAITTLEGVLNGFRAYQALQAALDLGVFELLDREPGLGREDIVNRLKINGMFIRSYLLALMDIGLVCEREERYFNTETAECFLVQKSPLYQGDWIEQNTGKASRWNNLARQLQNDKPESYAFDAAPRTDFIRALGQRCLQGELQGVTREVSSWDGFADARTILDLGGGHGLYAIALCQINSRLRGVIFDKPHVVAETQRFINAYGMSDRLEAVGGDIDSDKIAGGCDIVMASHVLYKFRKDMPRFFHTIRQALRPGGLLVSNHWFCEPGCIPSKGVAEMDKALWSFGHPLCHIEKFDQLLNGCGLTVLSHTEIRGSDATSDLHLAVKAQDAKQRHRGEAAACCPTR